jgi:Homeodomain-like domain
MSQTVNVILAAEDRERLLAIARDRSRPFKHVQRARIVLLSAERLPVLQIAQQAGVSRPAVWRWQRRYGEEGIAGLLHDKTRKPGRPPLSTGVVAKVLALTCSEPPGDATHWTGRSAQDRRHLASRRPAASWLNAVEGFFSTITRRKIRRGVFKSVAELQDAIERYIKARNKTSLPFVWTASASAIFEKLTKIPVPSE